MEQVTGAAGELQRIRMSGVYIPRAVAISRATSNASFLFRPVSPYSVSGFLIPFAYTSISTFESAWACHQLSPQRLSRQNSPLRLSSACKISLQLHQHERRTSEDEAKDNTLIRLATVAA
jgi:hypothetical protein